MLNWKALDGDQLNEMIRLAVYQVEGNYQMRVDEYRDRQVMKNWSRSRDLGVRPNAAIDVCG